MEKRFGVKVVGNWEIKDVENGGKDDGMYEKYCDAGRGNTEKIQ